MIYRILTQDDLKPEYRSLMSEVVFCPILHYKHTKLTCLACSRRHRCEKASDIKDLTVEDILFDPRSLTESTLYKCFSGPRASVSSLTKKKSKKTKRVEEVADQQVTNTQDQQEHATLSHETQEEQQEPQAVSKDHVEDQEPVRQGENTAKKPSRKHRSRIREEALALYESNPNIRGAELARKLNISNTYANRLLKEFKANAIKEKTDEAPSPTDNS